MQKRFNIVNKQVLAKNVKRLDIYAPNISSKVKPGQFISLRPEANDESIPLTVIEKDELKGTITLIMREVGITTRKLGSMSIKDTVYSILGPLGKAAQIQKKGVCVCIATGIGTAQMLPVCRALKAEGNKVIGILGGKSKRSLLLEAQMRLSCNRLWIATEDGSYERRALATDLLSELLENDKVDSVYAMGSVDMMQSVCKLTRMKKIKTTVHLNPIMVNCMGMCGSCRVRVGGKLVLACIDGPEFDGHKVDFENYRIRLNAFKERSWDNLRDQSNLKKDESKTLTRFLSGILKS